MAGLKLISKLFISEFIADYGYEMVISLSEPALESSTRHPFDCTENRGTNREAVCRFSWLQAVNGDNFAGSLVVARLTCGGV